MTSTRRELAGRLAFYVLLTLLVWGIGPCRRGPWQDDVLGLFNGERVVSGTLGLLVPMVAPTRRLQMVPFALGAWSGHPVVFLQLLLGITWLAQGVVAHGLMRELLPGRREAALFAGALTLTATVDILTNSLVGLVYFLGCMEFTAAIWCALIAIRKSRWTWGALSGCLLAASLFTVDVAVPALPFVPLLLWWAHPRAWRRVAALTASWVAVGIPYMLLFIPFLRSPNSYARGAVLKIPLLQRLDHGWQLWADNFEPWTWIAQNDVWRGGPVQHSWPSAGYWLAVCLALAAFAASAWRLPQSRTVDERSGKGIGLLTVLLLAMAYATNVAYGSVQFWHMHYRTHIGARVWASLALAAAASWLWHLDRRTRWLTIAALAPFVGLGVWAGVVRQDYYYSTWRRHQRELGSLVKAAPRLQAGTRLLLWKPEPTKSFSATEAQYLTRAWMSILYDDIDQYARTFMWAPARELNCQVLDEGWGCPEEGRRKGVTILPFGNTVVFRYDDSKGIYELLTTLPSEVGGDEPRVSSAYRGPQLIVAGPLQRKQVRTLLLD